LTEDNTSNTPSYITFIAALMTFGPQGHKGNIGWCIRRVIFCQSMEVDLKEEEHEKELYEHKTHPDGEKNQDKPHGQSNKKADKDDASHHSNTATDMLKAFDRDEAKQEEELKLEREKQEIELQERRQNKKKNKKASNDLLDNYDKEEEKMNELMRMESEKQQLDIEQRKQKRMSKKSRPSLMDDDEPLKIHSNDQVLM
jgi:hypothetical protein